MVRAELVRSSWSFTAVPGSESTHVTFSSAVDPKGAIPRPLVAAAQRLGRDQLISALVEEARGRAPSPRFEHWAAAADAQGRAGHSTSNRAAWPSAALVRTARGVVAVVRGVATAATARCLAAGIAAANATTAARAEAVLAAARVRQRVRFAEPSSFVSATEGEGEWVWIWMRRLSGAMWAGLGVGGKGS